jgi:ATP-binding cassette subfamily F protein 3
MRTLDFSFRSLPFKGKQMLRVEKLTFGYEKKKPLVGNLDFSLNHGDRICIIGKNGMGKTTLLKLLAGTLEPDGGSIRYNPAVESGLFEQTNISSLIDSRTVEDEILYSDSAVDRQQARNICGAMMFSGDDALKKVSVLSGGEKSRVMLGKLLVTPVNLLLLDEPTNHLDMDSCDAMLAAMDSFDGAVIMVTHNEMFLHALADRLIVFQGGKTELYEGGYRHFLEHRGWLDESGQVGDSQTRGSIEVISRKELRKRRSEIIARRSRALKPLEKKVAQAEKIIEASEERLEELNRDMLSATENQDGARIGKIGKEIHRCETAIEKAFSDMEEITSRIGEKSIVYEEELHRLESLAGN